MKKLLLVTAATAALSLPAMAGQMKPLPNSEVQTSPEHSSKPKTQTLTHEKQGIRAKAGMKATVGAGARDDAQPLPNSQVQTAPEHSPNPEPQDRTQADGNIELKTNATVGTSVESESNLPNSTVQSEPAHSNNPKTQDK